MRIGGRASRQVAHSRGFPPVAAKQARLLVLGSLPGRMSLEQRQYYALPRNQFWPIMGELLGFDAGASYARRLQALRAAHVALWDVCASAVRPGSLDAAIDHGSVSANDFGAFFRAHPAIRGICFNGAKAGELYRRLVLPGLPPEFAQLPRCVLPSTSPAHAALGYAAKLERWRAILLSLG